MTHTPDITIRRATPQDADAIARILAHAFAPFQPLYTPAAYRATVLTAEDITRRLPEGPVWLALLDSQPVGTVSALTTPDGLYIRSMAVDPSARGRGLGLLLLTAAEDHAHATGLARAHLCTTPFLIPAIRLYQRCGYTRLQDPTPDLHGTPLIAMHKHLA